MSSNLGFNHLITKRIQSSFGKSKEIPPKSRKIKDKSISSNLEGISFNQSVDVKTHMSRQKHQMIRQRPSNTINFQLEGQKGRKQKSLLFVNSKRDFQGTNAKSVKLAYGSTSPKAIRQRINIYTSQKSIKQKKKRLSFSTNIRGQSQLFQTTNPHSPTAHTNTKQNQTVNIQKHMIIAKYQKIKQLLQQEKYSQASIYLKQIIPYIEDKGKKKQLYFWLIAALMKSSVNGKLETVENYIMECLEEFPMFYDVYLYWGKVKMMLGQQQEAIEIYEKAITINIKASQAYSQLANIYLQQRSYNQALIILKQGFQKSTTSISLPIKLIQHYKQLKLSLQKDIHPYLQRIQQNCGKKSTQLLYVLGYVENQKQNWNQALIYFQQSLKFNSNKTIATKSLEQIIKLHINKKDFYAACYDLKRTKHLNIDVGKIEKYETFLEGVNFVMKKKNQEGIKLLDKIKDSIVKKDSKKRVNSFFTVTHQEEETQLYFPQDSEIFSLTIQYLAYAYFKLGNHKETIKCYKLLEKVYKSLDKTSKYNMLLAEGIVLADFYHDFEMAFAKLQQAKTYLGRVEPYIYQSVIIVQKRVYQQRTGQKKKLVSQALAEEQLNASVIQALNLMQQGYQVNSSSSNLLYHRTILHLYFSSLKTAMNDINICIQKAEENLPKYFYLRGICFACMKNLKKAINQFSISISLSNKYSLSYLQRAKCYFLSGQTEMGFQDLKVYMDQCPDDFHVHKWIGDLLFEGTSYNDCVKAYNEMAEKITLDALCMRLKAEVRVGTVKQVSETMGRIRSHTEFSQQVFGIDIAAYSLLSLLMMQQPSSSVEKEKFNLIIQKKVKQLNDYLQSDVEKGKIFNLVDCMCLVGIGSFYTEKYMQAYEAFLLVFEFFKSTTTKNMQKSNIISQDENENMQDSMVKNERINTEVQQENLDLRQEDIYYNLFLCLLAMKDFQAIKKLCDEEMMSFISSKMQKKIFQKIMAWMNDSGDRSQKSSKLEKNSLSIVSKQKNKKETLTFLLQPRIQTPLNSNLRKFQISLILQKATLTIKTSLIWSPYHGTNQNLNFTSNAKKLVQQLHAGYIDNMPQGPWIRRNQFGVLFTDNILDEGNQSSFITTNRNDESPQSPQEDYNEGQEEYYEEGELKRFETGGSSERNIKDRKKAFLKEMRLDLKIQNKLNKIIKNKEGGEEEQSSNGKENER